MARSRNSITSLVLFALLPFAGCANTRDRLREAWESRHDHNNDHSDYGTVPSIFQGLSYASANDWNFHR
jgi:hypothetical protein